MKDAARITSRDNQHLKFARRVRDRKEPEFIFIEGKRLALEAFLSGVAIQQAFVSERFIESGRDDMPFDDSIRIFIIADSLIESIADTDSPQGVILIARRPKYREIEEMFEESDPKKLPVWVCLEQPSNPSNLGAVIRTAEAAGAQGIFVAGNAVDPFAPKTLRAAMGSAFRVPIASGVGIETILHAARTNKINVVSMDAEGEKDYLDIDWTKPNLLIVGSEAEGISTLAADGADHTIRIGIQKPVESLNLAVSAGIVLFEAARQNRLADR